jgi:hypothetical protein
MMLLPWDLVIWIWVFSVMLIIAGVLMNSGEFLEE